MAPSPVEDLSLIDMERGSNKGASKQRRDQINAEISVMRDLLPLPESARQRLSQLQIMSLSCVFIRKCNILQKLLKNSSSSTPLDVPCEFSQSLTGFLLVTTREGKLVYISENVTEYLGHSMVDMKTQGDSLFDIVDKRDHATVQAQLLQGSADVDMDRQQSFFCRMNMSRTLKRQAGFGDVKVMHVRGRFVTIPGEDLTSEQVFLAVCSPLITPDVKDTLIQNNTMVFKSVHKLDMNFIEVTQNGEFHLGMTNTEIADKSWYTMLHPEDIMEAREKHMQLIKSRHEMGCMLTVRMMTSTNEIIWVNIVMHVRQALVANSDEPVILCINQVISEQEAYHFKVQGHLFALYAPRSPDFIFGSAFCAPIPAAIDANLLPSQAAAFVPPPFFKNQTSLDSFQVSPNTQHYPQAQLINNPQEGGFKNGMATQVGTQQGHSNTLKALKRKLQENFTTTCKPTKVARMVKDGPGCGYMNTTCPTSLNSTFGSHGYKGYSENSTNRPMAQQLVAGGPMQMMFCQEPTFALDPLRLKQESPTSMTKMLNKVPSLEQVVPDVTLPQGYLTPDPSPSSSPEPVVKQEFMTNPSVIDPVVVAKHLCNLKKKQMEFKSNEKKSKNLPSLDVSFVDSFFDEICEFSDKVMDVQTQNFNTVVVKEEPSDNFHVDCLQQQQLQHGFNNSHQFNNIDIEDLLGLNRSDMPESPSSCISTEGVRDQDEQILPACENQLSPIASIQSVDEKLSCDDVLSMIAMTPESDIGTEPSDDVMDPDSWLLESCSSSGFDVMMSGSLIQETILKSSVPRNNNNNKGDKLCNLKQHISSWTPSGVLKSVEDSQ